MNLKRRMLSKKEMEDIKKRLLKKKIVFMCCFCGKGIMSRQEILLEVMNTRKKTEPRWQQFFCHKKCLKKALDCRCRSELVV